MRSHGPPLISRRRALTVLAGATVPLVSSGRRSATPPQRWLWQGTALGADATLVLHHAEPRVAAAAVDACLAEIERLEREFSLYRPDSALSRLNRDGVLHAPSLDMLTLLDESCAIAAASNGAFDITVQPLWRLYADHFAVHPQDTAGPSLAAIDEARSLIDYRQLMVTPDRIAMPAGMALTLNGIAQGYISDRVADLLLRRGWSNVLIDLGEIRTLGSRPDGTPWAIARHQPQSAATGLRVLEIRNRAVATSSGAGMAFGSSGRYHHLFDPRTGRSATSCSQVTVIADNATVADALATTLAVTAADARATVLRRFAGTECEIVETDGRLTRLTA